MRTTAWLASAAVLSLLVGCGDDDKGTNPPPPQLLQITNSPAEEISFDWSPDGSKVAFSTSSQGGLHAIWVVSASGGAAQQITVDSLNASAPHWSPDGSRIGFVRYEPVARKASIWVVGATGINPTPLTERFDWYAVAIEGPWWSSDGSEMAFAAGNIWIVSAAGGDQRVLASGHLPRWSPDGSKVAYESSDALWVIPAAGGTPVELVSGVDAGFDITSPCWSPDGTTIAYVHVPGDGDWDIWTIPSTGGTPVQLTHAPENEGHSAWSPDGSKIAFARWPVSHDSTPDRQVWTASASGTNETQITDVGDNIDPKWSPDGRRIAFASDRSGNWDIWVLTLD